MLLVSYSSLQSCSSICVWPVQLLPLAKELTYEVQPHLQPSSYDVKEGYYMALDSQQHGVLALKPSQLKEMILCSGHHSELADSSKALARVSLITRRGMFLHVW